MRRTMAFVGKRKGFSLSPIRYIFFFTLLIPIFSVVSLGIGAVSITPLEVWSVLTGRGDEQHVFIIENYRIPRMVLAILVGSGLAISGTILQSVIQNPLASPDVIGITKGAGLAACMVMILFPKSPVYVLPVSAFAGAALVAIVLYWFSYRRGVQPSTLALVGIGLGAVCQAGIQYLMVKYPVDVNLALVWLAGSLWGRNWEEIVGVLPWILILLPLVILFAMKLDILSFGDEVAEGLGENVKRLRVILLGMAVALAGACVAAVGSIGFVGLIVPHMARRLVGAKHKWSLPVSALLGSLFILVADSLGRGLFPPFEIPAGIVTAVVGAPYFLFLLRQEKKGR